MDLELNAKQITEIIASHSEWLFTHSHKTQSLTRDEIEVRFEFGKFILSVSINEGFTFWRVMNWKKDGEKLTFEVSKKFGKEKTKIELIPRVSSSVLTANINESRQERSIKIASLAASIQPKTEIEKVGLSKGIRRGTVGRYARIILKNSKERIAVTTDVAEAEDRKMDAFLASSLLWFREQQERKKEANKLWLLAQKDNMEALIQRIACLRKDLQRVISIFAIDLETQKHTLASKCVLDDLWQTLPEKISRPSSNVISDTAQSIVALSPDAIDVVRSRHAETLRFHGLPFCRIRKTMKRERIWFGVEADKRRELNQHTLSDFDKLINELKQYRNANAEDKRHDFYRLASEAWLESLLRRDISRLDPGLIIAPLHAQFRANDSKTIASRPVDLLALRRDGRLVVIELKTSEDREHIFQGVDYWRQIESHRRAGNIAHAKLFGDKEISDESPLVYLAAPLLSFHRKFQTLAKMFDPRIEIYRFDLNEDWRFGVKTSRRMKVTTLMPE